VDQRHNTTSPIPLAQLIDKHSILMAAVSSMSSLEPSYAALSEMERNPEVRIMATRACEPEGLSARLGQLRELLVQENVASLSICSMRASPVWRH
jgi:hypothetical protein